MEAMKIQAASRDPVEVQLKYPITMGDTTIESATVRRITQSMIEEAEDASGKSKHKQMRLLVQKATGLTPRVVQELDAEDFNAICEVVANFMGASQT
jgi:hypothetical protein